MDPDVKYCLYAMLITAVIILGIVIAWFAL